MERAAAACGFYVAARQDRKVGAGGVAILCREGVSAVPVHCEEAHEEDGDLRVEVCAALVRWVGETWQVVCGYRPPDSSRSVTRLPGPFFEAVFLHRAMAAVSMLEGPRTVIGGDFNWDGLHLTQEGTRLERRAGARADDD